MGEVLVSMEGIEKSFPGVHALSQCRLELRSGEVHALVGENGAGKSTLMKILTGVYQKDSGSIFFKGKEIEIPDTRAAQSLGISIIHQELNLMPHLTVAQNIFIGREALGKGHIFLNEKEINKKTAELFKLINLKLDPRVKVSTLTVAKQQMVEIAKALSFNSEVLVMDEPTAALTDSEIEDLFRIIKDLRQKGVGIIYISHRMDELKKITDRITVMRDGCYIDTVNTSDVAIDKIISMMVGRTVYASTPQLPKERSREIVLSARDLRRFPEIKDVSFELHKGEILGFAGLMGAGRTEVARAIFGADGLESGEIKVNGRKITVKSPADAVNAGIGYLSEDRKRYGLALGLSVAENSTLTCLDDFSKGGFIDKRKVRTKTSEYVDRIRIKTPSIQQLVKNLSGGNQQKVVIAKWLLKNCEILIFDEPTRGIDVGAKSEIYNLMNELAAQGKSIIMISSELPEILHMSHRVAVMCEGRLVKILDIKEANEEAIMKYATQRN